MKFPKKVRRFCPYCNKRTEQKISEVSSGHKRGSLKKGGIPRAKRRGLGRGKGNKGKWGSKPAVTAFKRKTKTTKKAVLKFTCQECKKSKQWGRGKRTGKLKIEAKTQ